MCKDHPWPLQDFTHSSRFPARTAWGGEADWPKAGTATPKNRVLGLALRTFWRAHAQSLEPKDSRGSSGCPGLIAQVTSSVERARHDMNYTTLSHKIGLHARDKFTPPVVVRWPLPTSQQKKSNCGRAVSLCSARLAHSRVACTTPAGSAPERHVTGCDRAEAGCPTDWVRGAPESGSPHAGTHRSSAPPAVVTLATLTGASLYRHANKRKTDESRSSL